MSEMLCNINRTQAKINERHDTNELSQLTTSPNDAVKFYTCSTTLIYLFQAALHSYINGVLYSRQLHVTLYIYSILRFRTFDSVLFMP